MDELPAGAAYMTLSHCWGDPKHKPLTLTLDTLAPFKKGIPWNTLPKTFADAIVFTRNMGIRYIWIDSLCIIQDCTDDWESQSGVMCEVYSGSYLNLAATGAADSRGGLFAERDERSVQPLRIAQLPPPGQASPSNSVVRYYDVVDIREWYREVEDAPLCRRGWIIQERALARRSLHFGKRQLHWECTSMQASESVPFGYPYGNMAFKSFDPLLPHSTSSGAALVKTWQSLVQTYTQAGLTKETDKLVAISGLAKAFAAQSDIQYFAGLWNYGLEGQLLWSGGWPPTKRPTVFCAPSWSWASTTTDVWFAAGNLDAYLITILGVRASILPPAGTFTAFGSIPLTIRGALIPGSLSKVNGMQILPPVLRIRTKPIGPILPPALRVRTPIGRSFYRPFSPDSNSEQDNTGPVLLLPIGIGPYASGERSKGIHSFIVSGIVLKATGAKGMLRRVGYFRWARRKLPGQVPIRKFWLLDYNDTTSSTDPSNDEIEGCEGNPLRNALDNISSKTDPLKGITEDMYHHYEEIGDSGDQVQSCVQEGFDWTRVFSGGFTFDLV